MRGTRGTELHRQLSCGRCEILNGRQPVGTGPAFIHNDGERSEVCFDGKAAAAFERTD